MMSVPSSENACNTYQPAKMRRGELRAVALQNRREPGQTTSPTRSNERLRSDSSNVGLPHKSPAEDCGFRIIREDSSGKCDLYSESDQSEATSLQTTPCYPSRWSTESCYDPEETRQPKKVLKEFVVVSKRNDNDTGPVRGSQTAEKQQTYKVSRTRESSTEPKVDYLDMTDSTVGTYHTPNKDLCSGNRTSTDRFTPSYTITREDKNVEEDSNKPRVQYRIKRNEQANGKMTDKGKTSNKLKTNNQKVTRAPNKSHALDKGEDSQFELRFPPLKPKIKVHLSPDNDSPLCLNDSHSHVKTRPDIRNTGHMPCSDGKPNVLKFVLTAANDFKEAGVRDRISRISRLRSENKKNTHCSTKEPENIRDEERAQKKRRKEGGMICLRPKGINTSLADKRNETIVISTRNLASFDKRDETSFPANCQRSHGQDKKHPEELHSTHSTRRPIRRHTIIEKICHPFYREIEKVSPLSRRHKLRLKALPGRTKLTAHISYMNSRSSFSEGNNNGTSLCLSRGKLPTVSSVCKKTIQSVPLRFDENRNRDYNFNFNSEDECEDKICANSFMGHYLYQLWKHQCLCDVRIKVGNSSFLAHKIVLAAFSDIFCPEDPQQVPALCFDMPDVTEEALCLILQYLYTAEMEITDSALEPVYTAASILEIHEITDLVTEILSKPSVENFEKYMTIRQNVGLPTCVMDFKEFIRDNLIDISDSSFILNMPYTELESLLRDPDVKIESEEDIMKFIIKWLEYNPCKRSKYAADLLTFVNFDCIGPENLSAIVEQSKHILDMSAMELIMGAFKCFALRNAENTSCSAKSRIKTRRSKIRPGYCNDNESASEQQGIVHNWKSSDSYECDESPYSECPESFSRDRENRSRITQVKSIQEIREAARRSCWGKCKDFPGCDRCESNPRKGKSDSIPLTTNQEITYTLRKKKNCTDSNSARPTEYREDRARSSSGESRCDHRPSPAKSDSDLDLVTCNNCACKNQRKAGQSSRAAGAQSIRRPDECCSSMDVADQLSHGGRGAARATHKCQMWSASRSSSRSSGSSRKCNTSSSGSSKKVTFR